MATYASYRRLTSENITDGTVSDINFATTAAKKFNILWVYGAIGLCTTGKCCLWTVPTGVKRATFDAWGAGGNGNGTCVDNRCLHYRGAQGGFYNSKTIDVTQGWTYTICAGGVFPCTTIDCCGCKGCASYVVGCNLSNFCALGGLGGCYDGNWSLACFSEFSCCIPQVALGGDFGMENHHGGFNGNYLCHCYPMAMCGTSAPFLAGPGPGGCISFCWCRSGECNSGPVFLSPFGAGGMSGMSTYCGTACSMTGGTGGSGVVKLTYI
jgi:hypothetical protein